MKSSPLPECAGAKRANRSRPQTGQAAAGANGC